MLRLVYGDEAVKCDHRALVLLVVVIIEAVVHLPEVHHVTWHRAKRTIVRDGHFHAL